MEFRKIKVIKDLYFSTNIAKYMNLYRYYYNTFTIYFLIKNIYILY